MTRSETIVTETYNSNPLLWQDAWKNEVVCQIANAARLQLMSICPVQAGTALTMFDTPQTRASLVESRHTPIVDVMLIPGGQFRTLIARAFTGSNVRIPSNSQLRAILDPLVSQSLRSPTSSSILSCVTEHDIYAKLAHILSAELHGIPDGERRSNEPMVLNYAILIYHFRRWLIPFKRIVSALSEFESGPLGMRGQLISIQNTHASKQNLSRDNFSLPIATSAPVTFSAALRASSDLFDVISNESDCIPSGNGFFHRAMPIQAAAESELLELSPIANQELVEESRRINYPQFEHTAVLFMSIAAIEFLIRSTCSVDFAPDESLPRIIASSSSMPDDLRAKLTNIFATDQWNMRNRCVHGSFLDINARREDVIRASGILTSHGVPVVDLTTDGSLPANASALALAALRELSEHLDGTNAAFLDSWTTHYILTPEETIEASQIHCDILESVESAEAWRVFIRDYIRSVTPAISTAIQWGVTTWIANGAIVDAVPGFHFLALLFEPLLRLTLHLRGMPILQHSVEEGGDVYRVQYLMLDSRGLLSPPNVEWLTSHLDAGEKEVAIRTLTLAVKCRDAVAHGAVTKFSEEVRSAYGHVLVKAIQLTVEAGENELQKRSRQGSSGESLVSTQ